MKQIRNYGLKMRRNGRPMKGWTQAEKDGDRKQCGNCGCERYSACLCPKK